MKINIRNKEKELLTTTEELKTSLTSENGKVRCAIISETGTVWAYRYLESKLVPGKSIPVNDEGILTHYLCLDDSKLIPLNYLPKDNEEKTPHDCFEAGFWEELEGILGVGNELIEKIKIGVFVGLSIGLMIILFLISTMAMGS